MLGSQDPIVLDHECDSLAIQLSQIFINITVNDLLQAKLHELGEIVEGEDVASYDSTKSDDNDQLLINAATRQDDISPANWDNVHVVALETPGC